MPPLSIILWLPVACALLGAAASLIGRRTGVVEQAQVPAGETSRPGNPLQRLSTSGGFALLGSLGALGLAIGYIADYSPGQHGLKHVTDVVWIAELGIHYKLGVDGLNVFMIGLTTLLFAAAVLAANMREWERPRFFYFNFMLAETAVLGALLAQDLALFVAFFDLMLIPFYFLVGVWGSDTDPPTRVRATIKLVIYTLVGSLLVVQGGLSTG